MTTTTRLTATLREFADSFETAHRVNGGSEGTRQYFVRLADGSPGWMTEIVKAAHDSCRILPDDGIYSDLERVAVALAEHAEYGEPESAEDLEDEIGEIADGLVDVYTSDLLAWVSNPRGPEFTDRAQTDGLLADDATLDQRIMAGQYLYFEDLARCVLRDCAEVAEEEGGADDGDPI